MHLATFLVDIQQLLEMMLNISWVARGQCLWFYKKRTSISFSQTITIFVFQAILEYFESRGQNRSMLTHTYLSASRLSLDERVSMIRPSASSTKWSGRFNRTNMNVNSCGGEEKKK